jgi:aspartyl-tRNA(Asn)/glutamyl-tRNA(Gln) amidotransferase subunit B
MWETGRDAAAIVAEKGLKQITDTGAIEAIVDRLIVDNPTQVQQFKGGNEKVLGWFVGQIMKATQGKANPAVANQLLREKLAE